MVVLYFDIGKFRIPWTLPEHRGEESFYLPRLSKGLSIKILWNLSRDSWLHPVHPQGKIIALLTTALLLPLYVV